MEDIPGLISVNAIAAYLADAGDLARANAFREETLNMLAPTVTVSENYFLKK